MLARHAGIDTETGQLTEDEDGGPRRLVISSDFYAVYQSAGKKADGLVNLYCWAHIRRYFVRAGRVSDILCAGLFPVRYRMFIRRLSFALSDVPVPGLFSGPAESDLPLLVRADAACPGYPGVCCCPGRLLPDPLRIAWRPFPSVI